MLAFEELKADSSDPSYQTDHFSTHFALAITVPPLEDHRKHRQIDLVYFSFEAELAVRPLEHRQKHHRIDRS